MPASAFALCAKILAKGTRGVDFTNVLREAFMQQDPKSAKKTDRLTVIIVLLGFARVKAVRRALMKLIPGGTPGCPFSFLFSLFI